MTPLRRLLTRHLLGIQIPLVALLLGLVWWGSRSMLLTVAHRDGEARLRIAVQALDDRLRTVERAGRFLSTYAGQGRLPFADPAASARLLMPWLFHQGELCLVNFVDERGRSLLLVNIHDEGWRARVIRLGAGGLPELRWQQAGALGLEPSEAPFHPIPGFDVRRRPWYQEARQLEAPRWSVPYRLDAPQSRLVMTWLEPLRGPDGRPAGALGIDLLAEDLQGLLQALRPTAGSRLWLQDRQGLVLSTAGVGSPDEPPPGPGDRATLADLPHRVLRREVPTHAGSQWQMVLAIPERDLLATAQGRLWTITAAAFVLLLVPILWSLWVGRRLSKDIQGLARAADQLGAGIVPELPTHRVAEFQTLGHALHRAQIEIQDRHALQDQLQHSQRLETLGTLAGGIAHDVNNHLSAIMGQIFLASELLPEGHASLHRLAQAQEAAGNCARTTKALLAFGRHGVPDLHPLDLNSLVADLAVLLGRVLGGLIRVDLDLDQAPAQMLGDALQLEQVLMNLAVNARDAMPEGGVLSFRSGRMPDGSIRLAVQDTGTGIPPETLTRVFEPFFTTKPVGKGTGLGLSLVHGIVHNHGGRITVESHVGSGTTFTLTFPLDPSKDRAPVHEDQPLGSARSLANLRIMVAEDEEYLLETLKEILTAAGAQVVGAATGDVAWRRFRNQPFDCVLSDQRMPGCTGMELLRHIRGAGSDTPFILASGQDLEPFRQELALDPKVRLLAKPFTIAAFMEVVGDLGLA